MSTVRLSILLAMAVCFTGDTRTASAQETAGTADTVQLRFDWPDRMTTRVRTTRYRERVTERADTVIFASDYRMNVTPHADGLLVSYDDFQFPESADTTAAAAAMAVAARLASVVPELVVSDDGDFVRIHDVAAVRSALMSMFGELIEDQDELAAMRNALDVSMSEEALTEIAAQEWNALVGMWVEADLELGVIYEVDDVAPMPVIPGAVVPMISRFSVVSRTSCGEDGIGSDCVEIQLVTYPDPDSMKVLLMEFMERMVGMPGLVGGIIFEEIDIENEVVLITEPSTLRPHLLTVGKSMRGIVSADGESAEVSSMEVTTYRYTYNQ